MAKVHERAYYNNRDSNSHEIPKDTVEGLLPSESNVGSCPKVPAAVCEPRTLIHNYKPTKVLTESKFQVRDEHLRSLARKQVNAEAHLQNPLHRAHIHIWHRAPANRIVDSGFPLHQLPELCDERLVVPTLRQGALV